MKIRTRLHNNKGQYLGDVTNLDFGKIVAGAAGEPQIISLKVDDVTAVDGISLQLLASDDIDVEEGAFRFAVSKTIVSDPSTLQQSVARKGEAIPVRNLSTTVSEYVYLWVDSKLTAFRGNGSAWFRWLFDSVEQSSSSSSSSAHPYASYITVNAGEFVHVGVINGVAARVDAYLNYIEHATLFITGDAIPIENNGDTLVFNGVEFSVGETHQILTSTQLFSVYFQAAGSPFEIIITRLQYSSSSSSESSSSWSLSSSSSSSTGSASSSSSSCSSSSHPAYTGGWLLTTNTGFYFYNDLFTIREHDTMVVAPTSGIDSRDTYYYVYDYSAGFLKKYNYSHTLQTSYQISGAAGEYTDVWVDEDNDVMYGVVGSAIRGHDISNPTGPVLYSATLATPNRGYGVTGYGSYVFAIGDQYFTRLPLNLSSKMERKILFSGGKDGVVYGSSWYVTMDHETEGQDLVLQYSLDSDSFPTGTPTQYPINITTNLRIGRRGT